MKAADTEINVNSVLDDIIYANDVEIIPSGKSNYIDSGNNIDNRDEWKQKKRRANRLKRKKKDKFRRENRDY